MLFMLYFVKYQQRTVKVIKLYFIGDQCPILNEMALFLLREFKYIYSSKQLCGLRCQGRLARQGWSVGQC
jgi:hypothetical protein